MPEEKDELVSPQPANDTATALDQAAFDEYAQMAARTAIWPIGALSAFAMETRNKKTS